MIYIIVLTLLLFTPNPVHALECSDISMTITSPTPYQTYQRQGNKADIQIEGTINDIDGLFQSLYKGQVTQLTNVTYENSKFKGTLAALPQGQDTLTLTWTKDECTKTVSVPYVGIGDIFLVAGQSNHESTGINHRVYTHPTLKATSFNNDYVWKELRDPFDDPAGQIDQVSNTERTGGTYIPLLATKIMAYTKVPVAFIPSAKGGSVIQDWRRNESNHFDRTTLYGSAVYRAKLQNSIRGILWWQGESDVTSNTTTTVYKTKLLALANNFSEDMGQATPLVAYEIGQVFTHKGSDPARMRIVQAIREAAADSSLIILGPTLGDVNLDTPAGSKRVHFASMEQQQLVAGRVFPILKNEIFNVVPITKPGDFNADSKVDILDYNILVTNFGNPYTTTDYNNFIANFEK